MTMRNSYMGLMVFPLLITGLLYGNRRRNMILLARSLFCIAVAMGKYLPVRALLFSSVPLMKIFRHAAILRGFTLLGFLLIAADGLQVFYQEKAPGAKQILLAVLCSELLAVVTFFFISIRHQPIAISFEDFASVKSIAGFNAHQNLHAHLFVQSLIQALLLCLALLICFFGKGKKLAIAVSVLWITDVAIAAQLNVPGTVVSTVRSAKFESELKKLPQGFPINSMPVERYNQFGGAALEPVVYNASILRKEPCTDAFNPFCLKAYTDFYTSPLAHYTFKEPLVFASAGLKPISSLSNDIKNGVVDSSSIYADDSLAIPGNSGSKTDISLQVFEPGCVKIIASTNAPAFLTLLQSYYPGWQATIDGHNSKVIKTNQTFMTVQLASGKHEIQFSFQPRFIYWLMALQWLSLLLGLVFIWKRKNQAAGEIHFTS
jgi:hypothetical protein